MTALCGYKNGDLSIFGCTSGINTILPTTCVEAEAQGPTPTIGAITCDSDAPYCATVSLYWSDYYYTHWECATRSAEVITILAVPTVTGHGDPSTQYLNAAFSDPTASPSGGGGGGNGTNGDDSSSSPGSGSGGGGGNNIGTIIGAVAGVVAALAAIGLWICTKHHFHRQRQHDRNLGGSRDMVVRNNRDMMTVAGQLERGGPVNVYVNELHYHDHTGRGGPLRLAS
ncbi:hypothetical protein AYO20_06813 [Fonsecaea nubica]|uniref:Uncharacterized protein n=1 Tax=Fonsecaea nubica TaxID=856822 RepID=A0A178CVY2_9EURO|nr:hypothetical protein AYO20_06813 [Fonsecaea nubica]OAL33978.1 hypothetical protein AYO20_06813 [Fonsecaea nubica]